MNCANHSLNVCGTHLFGVTVHSVTFFGIMGKLYINVMMYFFAFSRFYKFPFKISDWKFIMATDIPLVKNNFDSGIFCCILSQMILKQDPDVSFSEFFSGSFQDSFTRRKQIKKNP